MLRKISAVLLFSFSLAAISFAQDKKNIAPTPEIKAVAVSYGIVVDNSGSYRTILDTVIELVHNIVEENKADDETFLVRFVDAAKTKLLQDFTHSKDAIHGATEEMFIEGGQTAILDAVDFSGKYLAENSKIESSRRILVLITDGEDRQSKSKIEDVVKFLRDEKIQVFTIGLSDEKVFSKNLDKLSKDTGGKNFTPKNRAEINSVAKELAAAMRAR